MGKQISLEDLSDSVREEQLESTPGMSEVAPAADGKPSKQLLKDRVNLLEMNMIRDAMTQTGNDKRRTAKMLGLSHQGLLNKLKRYGLGN
jgi:DNA-binding NtrC family response regulator